ncbi:MAG TPA: hypothetical protein VFE54_11245 [Mucilaginibacter sp.]|jgi:hypothetical protein|nr:hypothetical protein [Mucilaginibacter sp.]
MYHPFSVADTVKTSWYIFKRNFVTITVYSVIAFIALVLVGILFEVVISPEGFTETMVVSMLLLFVQAYTTLGLYKLIFTVIDSEYYEFEFKQVVPTIKMVFSYLAVAFIIGFFVTNFNFLVEFLDKYPAIVDYVRDAGVIVALYIALRFMFFNTFIVDDHSGPLESLRQSLELTKGYLLKLLAVLLIIVIFIALPAKLSQYYPLVSLTIIFTYPFVNIILAVTYRKLIYSHQDLDDAPAETK